MALFWALIWRSVSEKVKTSYRLLACAMYASAPPLFSICIAPIWVLHWARLASYSACFWFSASTAAASTLRRSATSCCASCLAAVTASICAVISAICPSSCPICPLVALVWLCRAASCFLASSYSCCACFFCSVRVSFVSSASAANGQSRQAANKKDSIPAANLFFITCNL